MIDRHLRTFDSERTADGEGFIDGYQIAPVESDGVESKHFATVFGSSLGMVLMRLDS